MADINSLILVCIVNVRGAQHVPTVRQERCYAKSQCFAVLEFIRNPYKSEAEFAKT
jgi:hypothetical protein